MSFQLDGGCSSVSSFRILFLLAFVLTITVSLPGHSHPRLINTVRHLEGSESGAKPDAAQPAAAKKSTEPAKPSHSPKNASGQLSTCQSFEFFNKELSATDLDAFRGTKFCSNVSTDCCDSTMLMKLAKWWQGPNQILQTSFSRAEIRNQKLTSIAYFTSYFLKLHKSLRKWAESLIDSDLPDPECKTHAKNFQSLEVQGNQVVNLYLEDLNTCWSFINRLQTSILCGSCNSKLQKALDFPSGKIFINQNGCKEIATNCWAMAKRNIEQVFPYIKAVEGLSRCSFEGKNTGVEELVLVSSGTVLKEMPDTSDKVDGSVCGELVS
jgi:hypothetical protein